MVCILKKHPIIAVQEIRDTSIFRKMTTPRRCSRDGISKSLNYLFIDGRTDSGYKKLFPLATIGSTTGFMSGGK
jgi:hypothetical protein